MKYSRFTLKLISLVLIVLTLIFYQRIAVARAEQVAANEAAIAEVEEYNQAVLLAQREAQEMEEEGSLYTDGVYGGEGTGFGGVIRVSVTVEQGEITEVQVLSAEGEDTAYFAQAESVLDEIVKEQSAEVDTVSGATFSSGGLLEATRNALEKAVA